MENSTKFNKLKVSKNWNFASAKEDLIHRIHSYPAKFPAFITTMAIDYAKEKNVEVKTIGDIFCGCGTTAYEARKAGINFWGCDINPIATLIAKVKSETYKIDKLITIHNEIIKYFDNLNLSKEIIDFANINDRIKYWYNDEIIKQLTYLKNAINFVQKRNGKYKKFFLVAFSNILKSTSRWLNKSIKPTIDKNKKTIDVRSRYIKQFNLMLKAFKSNNNTYNPTIEIENVNILNHSKNNIKLDLIVTSPPYITSYEYADLHQLSSLWLNFTKDFRQLRKGSIGSTYHKDNIIIEDFNLNAVAKSIISKLEKKDKSRSRNAAKYYYDMEKVIQITYDKLNNNALAFFVIGNTEYKGVKINNAEHLYISMKEMGFESINIIKRKISNKILTPYRDKQGKFTSSKKGRKIYAEEFILIGKKV